MGKIVDRAQRRELISEAAERQRRLRGLRVAGRRPAATCPNCGALFEGEAAPGARRAAESQAPGALLS